MTRGATTAGLLPEQPLLAWLSAPIDSATAACLDARYGAERPTAALYLQQQPKQQTKRGRRQSKDTPAPP